MTPMPCPWCGNVGVTCAETSTYRWAAAHCNECGVVGPEIRKSDREPEEAWMPRAIKAWNGIRMTPIEILHAGRALIADPARWTKKELAVNSYGGWCDPQSCDAVRFCSIGALEKFAPARCELWSARKALSEEMFPQDIGDFNDTHTHAEVLEAWDRAIARLESA